MIGLRNPSSLSTSIRNRSQAYARRLIKHNTSFCTQDGNVMLGVDPLITKKNHLAATFDFQQCDILTSVDSDEPVQPPFKLRNSK